MLPFIDLERSKTNFDRIDRIQVLEHGKYILGPEVGEQKRLSDYTELYTALLLQTERMHFKLL